MWARLLSHFYPNIHISRDINSLWSFGFGWHSPSGVFSLACWKSLQQVHLKGGDKSEICFCCWQIFSNCRDSCSIRNFCSRGWRVHSLSKSYPETSLWITTISVFICSINSEFFFWWFIKCKLNPITALSYPIMYFLFFPKEVNWLVFSQKSLYT